MASLLRREDAWHAAARPGAAAAIPERFLFFTNECVGLGHLRRSTTLAGAVGRLVPGASSLIVTGAAADLQDALPPGVDTIRLPALQRDGAGALGARSLGASAPDLHALRSQVALATATAWQPDVVVVDKLPLGIGGELRDTLVALRAGGRCRILLGLRDIEDDPVSVRRRWHAEGTAAVLRELYDGVLVYGPEGSGHALHCAGSPRVGLPVHHVGYVGTPLPAEGPADLPEDYLLVTMGGGADGCSLAAAVIEALRLRPLALPVVVVAGPLMPTADVTRLRELATGTEVMVLASRRDQPAVIVGARAVVSMAGYNTVSEVLRAGKPLLLVPRVRPSSEQLLRATHLLGTGAASMLHPDDVTPASLRAALDVLLEAPSPDIDAEEYDGAQRAARLLAGSTRW